MFELNLKLKITFDKKVIFKKIKTKIL